MEVKVKKVNSLATVPKYATKGSAGFDLASVAKLSIKPGETRVVPTGLSVAVPEGFEMQIRPRSGMSLNTKLRVANSPGTIDADYRGEVGIILHNTGSDSVDINVGDRIAQGVVCPVEQVTFKVVEDLDATERASGGFGSTGATVNDEE